MKIIISASDSPIIVTIEGADESLVAMVKACKELLKTRKTWLEPEGKMTLEKTE